MKLSPIVKKLIILAMDPSAPQGEREVAAIKLIHFLRKDFSDGHAFVEALESVQSESEQAEDIPNTSESNEDSSSWPCPFGKHKGKPLREVPSGWLSWALRNIPDLFPHTRKMFEAEMRKRH